MEWRGHLRKQHGDRLGLAHIAESNFSELPDTLSFDACHATRDVPNVRSKERARLTPNSVLPPTERTEAVSVFLP
jgi:hypothetical protein